jgi:hypothetical protein
MFERFLSRNALEGLALGLFISACGPSTSLEEPSLGKILQSAQGGSLGSAVGSSVATGNICGLTSDTHPSCANSPTGPDVVYSWTAPASDRYTFTTATSNFDTVLVLQSPSLVELACNDDDEGNFTLQSTLNVDLSIGQQVLVTVDSYGTQCGNYVLGISAQCGGCDTPPGNCHQPAGACVNGACVYSLRPAGSACDDGNACTTGDTCNASGVCSGTAGGCGTTDIGSSIGSAVAQGNTCGRPNAVASTCGHSNASDQSYTWTAPVSGTFTFSTAGSSYDTVLQLHDLATQASLGCNDNSANSTQSSVTVTLSKGQQLRITIDGFSSSCGAFTLNIHQGSSVLKRGLTWVQSTSDNCGQTRVTCDDCNPYTGDTLCTQERPLLCIKPDGSANCGEPASFYDGWTSGTVALTPFLVSGTQLTSLAAANAICATTFGTGYRMAEHHDGGGGWGWRAKGNITPLSTPSSTHPRSGTPNLPNRFWVHIKNQPGNCWD